MGKEQTFVNLLKDSDHLISEYRFIEKRTGEFAPPTIFITFVELGRFGKSEDKCLNERDRVFYWFNNSYMADESPSCASSDPEMHSLVEATRIAAFPPEKKNIYNRDIMTELDIKYSEKKKFEAGKAEGELEKAIEVARNLMTMGLTIHQIADATNLTEKQLKELM